MRSATRFCGAANPAVIEPRRKMHARKKVRFIRSLNIDPAVPGLRCHFRGEQPTMWGRQPRVSRNKRPDQVNRYLSNGPNPHPKADDRPRGTFDTRFVSFGLLPESC